MRDGASERKKPASSLLDRTACEAEAPALVAVSCELVMNSREPEAILLQPSDGLHVGKGIIVSVAAGLVLWVLFFGLVRAIARLLGCNVI